MQWMDLRIAYPAQWLVIEMTDSTGERVQVIELCADGCAAKHRALELRHTHPGRSFCCVHTSYPTLAFDRPAQRAAASR
jgi:hypothetical protein